MKFWWEAIEVVRGSENIKKGNKGFLGRDRRGEA